MPTYSYECEACRKKFTLQLSIAEHDTKKVKCPKCGSRKVRQRIEPFAAVTSRKS